MTAAPYHRIESRTPQRQGPRLAARTLVLACMLSALAMSVATEDAPSEVTQRTLDAISSRMGRFTATDKRIAEQLNAEGDGFYRKGDYLHARRAYWNSYPNYPNVHAYIFAGDAYWREALAFAQMRTRPDGGPRPKADESKCSLSNEHFASELDLDVQRHLAVGLALAAKENGGQLPDAALFRRARDEAACLSRLAERGGPGKLNTAISGNSAL